MNVPEARKQIDLAYGKVKPVRDRAVAGSPDAIELTAALKRLVAAKTALAEPAPAPTPTPPPPIPQLGPWAFAEAICAPGDITSLRFRELHTAGFRRFSTTIVSGDHDDASVIVNLRSLPTYMQAIHALGGLVGGFCVMRGENVAAQAQRAVERASQLGLDYLLFDVEDYKADAGEGRAAAARFGRLVDTMQQWPQWNAVSSFVTFGDTFAETPLCSPWQDGLPVVDSRAAAFRLWPYFGEFYASDGSTVDPGSGVHVDVSRGVRLMTACYPSQLCHAVIGSIDCAPVASAVLAQVKAGKIAAGFSVWDAANLSDGEIAALRDVILAGAAAT